MLSPMKRGSMAVKQALHDNLDLIISVAIVFFFATISKLTNYISIQFISPKLAAAIFTVVVGSTGTLFSILIVYSRIIRSASEKNYLTKLKRTFTWPFHTAILGFIIAVLASIFRIQDPALANSSFIFSVRGWFSVLMGVLLIYSILSFREAFFFVTETTVAAAVDDDDNGSR